MDEITQRLKEASEATITAFEAWRAKPNDATLRENLQEAVHEMRKISARLEIELAVSDRKTQGADPIPIPSHRASRRQGPGGPDMDADDENRGQRQGGHHNRDGNRDGNRSNTPRPVQIRTPAAAAEGSAQPGNDAASGDDDGSRKKPLSLKRTSNDGE